MVARSITLPTFLTKIELSQAFPLIQVIRETWGDPRLYPHLRLRPLFFLGRSADPVVEQNVALESRRHGDIVVTDYLDSYQNLTFKAVSWMKWVGEHCAGEEVDLVKTDDDILVDIFKYEQFLFVEQYIQVVK